MLTEVYETKPEGFKASVEISGCYLEIDGRLLLLECASSKPEAGRWGVPAGKLEKNETPEEAAQRELFEETGIAIESSCIHSLGSLYVRKPDIDYAYHLFRITLKKKPEVKLSNEHPKYLWASYQDLEDLPLMAGALDALKKYRKKI
jgi:8-oxo-dGTP diphosphatase